MSLRVDKISRSNFSIKVTFNHYSNLTTAKIQAVYNSIITNPHLINSYNFLKTKASDTYNFFKIKHFFSAISLQMAMQKNNIKVYMLSHIEIPLHLKVASILFPAQDVSKEEEVKEKMKDARNQFISTFKAQEIDIKTFDNENINGMLFKSKKNNPSFSPFLRNKRKKIVIHFNGMGEMYEDHVDTKFIKNINKHGYDLFLFNYRNIGKSTGTITKENIIKDSFFIYDFIRERGYEKQDIILHGHSLGGSLATTLASFYEESPIINDRSFSSLIDAATQIIVQPIKNAFNMQDDTRAKILIETKIKSILSFFLNSWNIDVSEMWKKMRNKKIVIVSKKDEIIYYYASLAKSLNEKFKVIVLNKMHNDELLSKEWKKIFKELKN